VPSSAATSPARKREGRAGRRERGRGERTRARGSSAPGARGWDQGHGWERDADGASRERDGIAGVVGFQAPSVSSAWFGQQ
jgi:hypothetical protein